LGNENVKLLKQVQDHETRISALEKLFESKPGISKKKISVKEFILEKKPNSDTQKTLIIGFYLENYQEMENFNVGDLKSGFNEAKEKFPSNINREIANNISRGYLMKAKEKNGMKAWTLTNSGERFVEEGSH
jgi:hypothetical protein